MAKGRAPKKLLEVAYASARANGLGVFKAIDYSGEAITLAAALAVAHIRGAGRDGEWPSQLEYAEHYGVTDRTAQRRWAAYRAVFGKDADPNVLARYLLAEIPSQLHRLAEVGKPEEVLDLELYAPPSGFALAVLA